MDLYSKDHLSLLILVILYKKAPPVAQETVTKKYLITKYHVENSGLIVDHFKITDLIIKILPWIVDPQKHR